MKIAIDCCDLDQEKIDGTRVYIKNVLDRLGALAPGDQFLLFHQRDFNPLLAPRMHPNYRERKIPYPVAWTQTRLAFELNAERPDVLWMPIQQIPLVASKQIKSAVTIHDLAWKYFPQNYQLANKLKLDFFAQTAIKRADCLIAVSESTKKDILKFYPRTDPNKISVVHHGFDRGQFEKKYSDEEVLGVLKKYGIVDQKLEIGNWKKEKGTTAYNLPPTTYLLYVGGLDDKENLGVLIEAFEKLKDSSYSAKASKDRSYSAKASKDKSYSAKASKDKSYSAKASKDRSTIDKLVLVGNDNENSKRTLQRIAKSPCKKDICATGRVDFDELVILYQNALALVLPSKYEGFGMTVLEGFASGIPVVTTSGSSLAEVGGEAAAYFDGEDSGKLAEILQKILENPTMREDLAKKGLAQAAKFSWEKCAQETLAVLKSLNV